MSKLDYTYNASALGLGGAFTYEGRNVVIPSIASVALSPSGGLATVDTGAYSNGGVSFSSASSSITGFEIGENIFETYISINITNLSLFDKLYIALMTANITSTRNTQPEGEFEIRASYHGVQTADGTLIPRLDVSIGSLPTYTAFADHVQSKLRELAPAIDATVLDNIAVAAGNREPLISSIVTGVSQRGVEGREHRSNAVPVSGLGKVHFGELIAKPGRRRLNLLRVKFGDDGTPLLESGGSGSLTVGSGDGNGAPVWPNQ